MDEVAGALRDIPGAGTAKLDAAFEAYYPELKRIAHARLREQRALRRGGDFEIVTLDTCAREGIAPSMDIEAVSQALDDLARLDEGLARLVEMRFFGGLTEAEIAAALGTSGRTVRREWTKARALLLTLVGN